MGCWFTQPAAVEVTSGETWIGAVRSMRYALEETDPWSLINNPDGYLSAGGHVVANSTTGAREVLWRGVSDDHINPALLLVADRSPLVFIPDGHADKDHLVLRRGTRPDDLTKLGAPQPIDFSAAGGRVSYAQAHHSGDRVLVLSRTGHHLPGPDTWWWSAAVSDDWGETWAPGRALVHWGAQAYFSSRQSADTVHIAASYHPDRAGLSQSIRYLAIDLPTGELRRRDGAVLGKLDGTNLPLLPEDLDLVHHIDLGDTRTWTYDCLPDGSPVWVEWDQSADPDGGTYRSARWDSNGWTVSDIAPCGARMTDQYPPPVVGETYRGGAMAEPGGDLWLSREDSGIWSIERHSRADDTWGHQETIASSTTRLVRPFVPYRQATGPRVVWSEVDIYAAYRLYVAHPDWDGNPASTTQ